jgi:hypothetical protein
MEINSVDNGPVVFFMLVDYGDTYIPSDDQYA